MQLPELVSKLAIASLLALPLVIAPVDVRAEPLSPLPPSSNLRPNILGGEPSDPTENAVVAIRRDGDTICSGVLVAPNLVLSARHCFIEYDVVFDQWCSWSPSKGGDDGQALFRSLAVDQMDIVVGDNVDIATAPASARAKQFIVSETLSVCGGHDIGFMVLDRDIAGVEPRQLRLTPSDRVDEPLSVLGWGSVNTRCERPRQRQRRASSVFARGPGFVSHSPSPAAPGEITAGESGRLFEGEFAFLGGACFADSGAPVVSSETGAVVGLMSRIFDPQRNTITPIAPCGHCQFGLNIASELWVERALVEHAFAAVGHAPWQEGRPQPKPKGSACELDADCQTGVCSAIDGTPTCVSACSAGCSSSERCRSDERSRSVCAQEDGQGCRASPGRSHHSLAIVPLAMVAIFFLSKRSRK